MALGGSIARNISNQNGSNSRNAGITFSPNSRIERIRSGSGKSEKLNSPMNGIEHPRLSCRANFFRNRFRRADKYQLMLHEEIRIE